MKEDKRNIITPKEAAAAMMQMTMRSAEHGWPAVKPTFAAYVPDAVLSEAQEDDLLKEAYIAALALEVYCIPHAFETDIAAQVGQGMDAIMSSEHFAAHRLAEPICAVYAPRLQMTEANAVKAEAQGGDLAMALLACAVDILYARLPLPLKPEQAEGSLLQFKLMQYVSGMIGKWPLLLQRFDVANEEDAARGGAGA
ncbi:hypothetical protein B5M42_003375 [Paenibacillus athensensis]|uniref:Uncharacterized protein n=1 Tax=Paenibacillus athensensis TaxID=1967502 RepID=A0A4Y8PWT0_9BACL|nr:hypothetical protein [Paenibacillus athensensis]MCD1257881.1 hypothetical protein [Paenibacillus athensensis]